mmetsp:Transcript_5397/g.8837  ORF Transcript_5397/g.8837 Transcript_5397/m.8837 type:complete len:299 (+) Transcript_5397:65-961(+)|eukprot:CAMPEP_0119013958 /NCGR_PEP_ID=MMETSP1176-20130426/9279_1 /TAXON_ID=265551 /ORGANISM="Synedropsis recta cf, Strain CCMP1620" /LENGTH=298 /DNA_ID=CAMNT_0006967089 /DNA_START=65 /DNA_END=961 /DNA_ORIENTATION=+
MGPDDDLPTLLQKKDHLNVLRYIRVHQLREPEIVTEHGALLLGGKDLKRRLSDESARLAALEQIALAALDLQNHELAETCLNQIRTVVGKDPARFRILLARCLEAASDKDGALVIYDELLQSNPSNLMALKRKYCLAESTEDRVAALNAYLQQNMADSAGWYEMAKLRSTMGDFGGASFALEEVVLGCPIDAQLHVQLAECYATTAGMENLVLARKHMAQAVELDPTNKRALFGLVSVSNAYLEEVASASKKQTIDDHSVVVAKELVKHGAEKLLKQYKGSKMYPSVQTLLSKYTKGL